MTRCCLYALAAILLLLCNSCDNKPTEVLVISSIHQAHKTNPNYSYEALFKFIRDQQPDLIGIEIRAEDMDSSEAYLKRYYPYEMRELRSLYPDIVVGFDWLGDDIMGKPIPNNYFSNLDILKLSLQMQSDSTMQKKLVRADSLAKVKEEMVQNATLFSMNGNTYDALNHDYYLEFYHAISSTRYNPIIDFYKKRDDHISNTIIRLVKDHPGKKLLFVMGADHRSFTREALQLAFGDDIIMTFPATIMY